jgi:divalent metal cation (Fe/Co/Zn/Cd) transporter
MASEGPVHLLAEPQSLDPYPPSRNARDSADRRDAYRAIAVSAVGLGLTGVIELGIALLHVGHEVTGDLVRHLMDGVDPAVLTDADRAAREVPGVEHAHVRGRWMGRSLLVEVEGFVAPRTSVGEAEALGRAVEEAVSAAVPEARAVVWCARPMTGTA